MMPQHLGGAATALSPAGRGRVAHIDGLRAVAVLAVVLYHAGVPGFGGGYVGVDVFFVISGYLIINHIVAELRAGTFRLTTFYARRVIRLLPPLLAMLAGSALMAGFVLVSHREWESFTLSLVFAALSSANFYFLSKQGYFDLDMFEKPLLHTWSLAVEEQFYFVAPVLLIGCFALARRRTAEPSRVLFAVTILVFAASLAGCVLQTSAVDRNPAFYLTWWRAWEFAAGGAVGYIVDGRRRSGQEALYGAVGPAALAALAISIFSYGDVKQFPGIAAVVPVLATAVLIATGFHAPRSLASRLLCLPAFGFIGLVSYGWYLWHWPLITFARIADFDDVSMARDLLMVAIAFLFAIGSWRWIEQPARRWRERHDLDRIGGRVFGQGVAACIAVALVGGAAGGGIYWLARQDAEARWDSAAWVAASACPTGCEWARGRTGVVVGDSHGDRLFDVLSREAEKVGADTVMAKLHEHRPADFAAIMMRWNLRFNGLDPVYGGRSFEAVLDRIVSEWLEKVAGPVLLIAPTPEFQRNAFNCVPRALRYGLPRDRCSVPRTVVDAARAATLAGLTRLAARHPRIRVVDPIDHFCDETLCRPYRNAGVLFTDDNHLVDPYGTDYLYFVLRDDFRWLLGGGDKAAAILQP